MRFAKWAVVIAACLIGCDSGRRFQVNEPHAIEIDDSPEIRYVIVEFEGERWLATPGPHGEWSLAGPIKQPKAMPSSKSPAAP